MKKVEDLFKDGREEQTTDEGFFDMFFEMSQTQIKENLFEINLLKIDRRKFEEPREDFKQEKTRRIIQEAFAEIDKHPEKYDSQFYTLIPKRKWFNNKNDLEVREYAKDLGGKMADWVEQALEWAQRISNGESWKSICNNADTAEYYRMIIWKDGCAWFVGGSSIDNNDYPASHIVKCNCFSRFMFLFVVPLVVIKKK